MIMINFINHLPEKVIGIEVTSDITKEEYDVKVVPKMNELANTQGEINYLIVLKTDISAFDAGVWWDDFKMALNHFTKWNKVAIVTDHEMIKTVTHLFGFAFPGEHKTFKLAEYENALTWKAKQHSNLHHKPEDWVGNRYFVAKYHKKYDCHPAIHTDLPAGFSFSYAQTDSIQWKKDSLNNARLNRQLISTQQLETTHTDSLKRADLQLQVSRLTSADREKREILLKELDDLKERDSLRVVRQKQQVDSLRRFVKGYPVAPFNDTLFYIYTRQGSFSAKERIRINSYELLNPEMQLKVFNFVAGIIRWIIILLLIYLALLTLFGIFPFTKDISTILLSYITTPLKIFRYVLRFVNYIKEEIQGGKLTIPGFYPDWANPTYQIIRVLVLAFMLIVIFPYLPGSDSQVFKGVSVFVGVLFTFGSAGALGNIVSGLVLTYMRAFKLGDRVKIGEVTGDIIGKTLLVTRIRTIQNEIISIPNSTVMSNHTVNYSSDAAVNGLIVHTSVTIDTPMIESEPKPYVYQTSLDDYYVSYRINAFTKEPNKQAAIYSHLHANIQDHFNKAGVEIMSPHYKSLRDVLILTWGGLGGGLSVALALSLTTEMHRDEFVLITYMVVVFSILIQGLTIGKLAKKLLKPVTV
eukprot:gene9407-9487_t